MSYRESRYGNLPTYPNGSNRGRLDRKKVANAYGFSHDEVIKAYNNWIRVDRIEGSTLTFESYLNKLVEAGISPNLVGKKSGDYNLSRHQDDGPYTDASCRFITCRENVLEQRRRVVPYEAMIKKYGENETRKILSRNRKGSL